MTHSLNLAALLSAVEAIAQQAGAEIMTHYAGTTIYTKEDGSNVTDADHAAENIILPALRTLTPHIPIVSEERHAAGDRPDVSRGTFWAVDPLDGTHEFIDKTGAFVVAIALIVDSKPVLGVIFHPAMDLLYSAAGAGTAFKTAGNGIKTPIVLGADTTEDVRVLVNERCSNMEPIKGYLTKAFGESGKIDSQSGILRACQVAESSALLAVVYGRENEGRSSWWDVAAGHAIVESAGGRLETLDGKALVYDAVDFRVPAHVVISPQYAAMQKAKPIQGL